ncbi:MAG: S-layer homology domain-containing protein [Oscillibacter sp.]|jgi:GH25 family lysozyme M1 (1,4-beta-N-acetylmuramidase)|nr:S-layer homology domain-containing protein [Oscillibacter sp.]
MRRNRRSIKFLALALAALLILPTAAAAAYSDTSGHWAEDAIDKWSGQYGILQGYDDGTFRPDNTITRGAFAGIMSRFLQYREEAPEDTFSDTSGAYWESAILKLNAAGVYLGTGGKALINHEITRQQAVTMIGRAFGLPEASSASLRFADLEEVQSYALGFLSTMMSRGYLTDTSAEGRFRPSDAITRAEVVSILSNMIEVLCQSGETYQKNTDGTLMISAADGITLKGITVGGDVIVAPGVTGTVRLTDVTVKGNIRNLGSAKIVTETTPQTPTDSSGSGSVEYGGKQYPICEGVEKSKLPSGSFEWSDYERRRLDCTSDTYRARQGIDVSTFQGNIDWQAVAADGIEFSIVRCGGRGTSNGALYTDTRYLKNVEGSLAAGLETGVYFFAQAVTVEEAREEADYVLSLLEGHNITGPVIYDWEILGSTSRTYGTDPSVVTACAQAFCKKLEDAGYKTGFYFTEYVGYAKYDLSQMTDYSFWFANYSYRYPHFYYQVDYWQYSSSGKVNGISGKVDMDLQFIPR